MSTVAPTHGRGLPPFEFEPQDCKTPEATDNVTMVTVRLAHLRDGVLTLRWKSAPGHSCKPIYRHGCSYLFSTPTLKPRSSGPHVVHTKVDICLDDKVMHTFPYVYYFTGRKTQAPQHCAAGGSPLAQTQQVGGFHVGNAKRARTVSAATGSAAQVAQPMDLVDDDEEEDDGLC